MHNNISPLAFLWTFPLIIRHGTVLPLCPIPFLNVCAKGVHLIYLILLLWEIRVKVNTSLVVVIHRMLQTAGVRVWVVAQAWSTKELREPGPLWAGVWGKEKWILIFLLLKSFVKVFQLLILNHVPGLTRMEHFAAL